MSPEVRRTDPPFVQIAGAIAADIASGKLGEGDSVPSARAIAASWGVAHATATRVLQRLQADGLTRAVPGVGTVVAASSSGFGGRQRLVSAGASGRVYGPDERAEIVSAAIVEAPARVADALGVAVGSSVVRRERIVRRDLEVVSASVSWLPGAFGDLAPKLLATERIRSGSFAYVQAAAGVVIDRGREMTCAAAATTEQALALDVPQGSPVLVAQVWFLTPDDLVVEYGESVRTSGRWSSHEFRVS